MDELFRVSQCSSAKEMWEVLEVTHEGTDDVKRSRKNSLIQEYELFRMQSEESIADVQKWFTHIVNHLTGIGKVFNKEELNIKVLKCLDRSWQPKVTAISESRDLSKMSTAALFGKLIEHEFELKRLKEQETVEKRAKGIALKTTMEHDTSEEEKNSEHDETLSLLTRKFSRFLKRKNRDRTQQRKRYSKSNDSNSSSYTCFGCGKPGHIKVDCPNNQNKEKSASKKSERGKGKRAYISWEENDVSSTSDSSTGSEEANLCFMVNDEGSASDSVSDYSTDSENYDQLLIAFKETHDEANRLAVICNKLNKVNRVLEPQVKFLEEELHKAKTELKNSRKNQWYLDSGCSKHMTGDVTQFTNLKLKVEGHVTYGDNNRGRILGRGDVDAVYTASYVLNRTLIRPILNKTPYELYKDCFVPKSILDEPGMDDLRTILQKNQSSDIDTTNSNVVKESIVNAGLPKEWKTPRDLTLDNVIGKIEKGVSTRNSLNNFFRTVAFVSQIEPKSLEEALQDINWITAMQEELNQFEYNEVWTLVPRRHEMNIIGTKWVYRNKMDEHEAITKARLVAKGYNQEEGIDFGETYAPVARLEAVRLLLAFSIIQGFKLFQMDVKSAFLNGYINEEVFVSQPPGFEDHKYPEHVYMLKKALYGLKQAPRKWYERLSCKVYRKSTSGTYHMLGSSLISWHCKKQACVALSTAEAEYIAAGSCYAQTLWLRQQLSDFGILLNKIPINCDNTSAINLSKNPVKQI
ncbi:uncharacterized protein [Phaseolus vulgaris]|uniref:uncharacterized protein n=1 Tax=Phaseolus vulgaris TaxID=3885 RepID=UPI0035CB549A